MTLSRRQAMSSSAAAALGVAGAAVPTADASETTGPAPAGPNDRKLAELEAQLREYETWLSSLDADAYSDARWDALVDVGSQLQRDIAHTPADGLYGLMCKMLANRLIEGEPEYEGTAPDGDIQLNDFGMVSAAKDLLRMAREA